jgi:hypothetical protein
MSAIELKFSGTFNNSDYLKDFSCAGCQQYITEQDILKGNYRLYVSDYANEVSKDEFFGERSGQYLTTYGLTFWLKAVEHEECPEEGD